jgi:hypothetical protein
VPLIEVSLARDTFDKHHEAIGSAIHDAQIAALGIPADDRFQIFSPRDAGELKFDSGYNGVDRRNLLVIRVTAVHMYPVAAKRQFFQAVVERLVPLGIRAEDVLISLTENGFEDWYAGKL